MPTRIAFQLHQKGVVGGRIFEGRGSIGEVGEVELLERLSGAESSERTERSGADRSGMERDAWR